MTSTLTPSTHRANFAIGSEVTAKRVVDLLTESFFEGQAAIAAFEGPGGRWGITVHFADPPDQAAIRELLDKEHAQEDAARAWAAGQNQAAPVTTDAFAPSAMGNG